MVDEATATASVPYYSAIIEHSGFTPFRRPEKPPVNDSPALPSHASWTATRCHRLLRPISSRILQLRKQKNLSHAEQSRKETKTQGAWSKGNETAIRNCSGAARLVDATVHKDPDWRPDDKPARKPKRTYSVRDGGAPATTLQQTERSRLNVLARMSKQKTLGNRQMRPNRPLSRETSSGENSDGVNQKAPVLSQNGPVCSNALKTLVRQLAKSTTGSWMLYEGLYNGLDALLRATAKTKPPTEQGARSLFAHCLRKVPAYIDMEQAWIKEEDPDSKEDAAEAIYGELESLSTAAESGWKPLKEVVRAHGMHMIDEAIRDGTIPVAIACKFETLCWLKHAYSESATIVSSILRSAQPSQSLSGPFLCATSDIAELINSLVHQRPDSQGRSSLFRTVTEVIENDAFPLSFVSSEGFLDMWEEVKRKLRYHSVESKPAAALVSAVVLKSYWNPVARLGLSALDESGGPGLLLSPQLPEPSKGKAAVDCKQNGPASSAANDEKGHGKAITELVSGLVAQVCQIAGSWEDNNIKDGHAQEACKNLLKDMALNGLQSHEIEERTQGAVGVKGPTGTAWRAMPLLALHLVTAIPLTSPLSRLSLPPRDDKSATDLLSSFVRDIACHKFVRRLEHEFAVMRRLVDRLLDLARTYREASSAADIAVTAAFEFAEGTGQQAHLDWALEIEEAVQIGLHRAPSDEDSADDTARRVSQAKTTASKFRWEASIGEWVTKTPMPKPKMAVPAQGPRFCIAVKVPTVNASTGGGVIAAADPGAHFRYNSTSAGSGEGPSYLQRKRKRSGHSHASCLSQHEQRTKRRRISARLSGPWSSKDRVEKPRDVSCYAAACDELATSHDSPSTTARPELPKRGRGRPRKIPRGRGRPPSAQEETNRAGTLTRLADMCMGSSSDDELGI